MNSSNDKISSSRKRAKPLPPPSSAATTTTTAWKSFKHLPLDPRLLRALKKNQFRRLTPVQRHAIPTVLQGHDTMVAARTGSGKTLTFLLPLVQRILANGGVQASTGTVALIISPTRELTDQIYRNLEMLTEFCQDQMSIASIKGGVKRTEDSKILREGVSIVVATPGRLLDHMQHTKCFTYDNLFYLVLDEADQLLDKGFEFELRQIGDLLPKNRQTLFFSATVTEKTRALAASIMQTRCQFIHVEKLEREEEEAAAVGQEEEEHSKKRSRLNNDNEASTGSLSEDDSNCDEKQKDNPLGVVDLQQAIMPSAPTLSENLQQAFVLCPPQAKFFILYNLLKNHPEKRIMVFMASCYQVKYYYELLNYITIPVDAIHGKKKQDARNRAYQRFNSKQCNVLLCTDVAARGLDFPDVDIICQYEAAKDLDQYVHRVGRTARAQQSGTALLLVRPCELDFIVQLLRANVKIQALAPTCLLSPDFYCDQKKLEKIVEGCLFLKKSAVLGYKSLIRTFGSYSNPAFNLNHLDLRSLAHTFGLADAPYVNLHVCSKRH